MIKLMQELGLESMFSIVMFWAILLSGAFGGLMGGLILIQEQDGQPEKLTRWPNILLGVGGLCSVIVVVLMFARFAYE